MAVAAATARQQHMNAPLPQTQRAAYGRERWYVLRVREGAEAVTCERLLKLLSRDVLSDCFCLGKERWRKHAGTWTLQSSAAYRGYAFAVTANPTALERALARLSVEAEPAGVGDRAWTPLSLAAQDWFERCMDERHVLRGSTAQIVDGVLCVTEGPLVGQEARIRKIDRHKRCCTVEVTNEDGGFCERMPLEVPFKS